MSRSKNPRCTCLKCNPPPPNPAWRYSPPQTSPSGRVVWVDACAIAPLLPAPKECKAP